MGVDAIKHTLFLPSTLQVTLDVCHHEAYRDVETEGVGHPQYYECLACGSKHPVIASNESWEPGIRVASFRIIPKTYVAP